MLNHQGAKIAASFAALKTVPTQKILLFDSKSKKMHKRLILLGYQAISAVSFFVIFWPFENAYISILFGRLFFIKFLVPLISCHIAGFTNK